MKYIAKFLTAVAGLAAQAVTLGLVHGAAAKWAAGVEGVITAIGVYLVPNAASTKK